MDTHTCSPSPSPHPLHQGDHGLRIHCVTQLPDPQLRTAVSALHTAVARLEVGKAFQAPYPQGCSRAWEEGGLRGLVLGRDQQGDTECAI
jgi:hypothetical protein